MKHTIAALILGFCTTVYSQTDYTFVYNSENFIAEGIKLHEEGNYKKAIIEFEKVVPNDPKFYTAQYEKALSLAALEDKDAAKAFYEEAFKKGYMAEAPDFYMAYGNFLSDLKEFDKAEKMLLEAQKLYPNSSAVLYNLAVLYVRKEERQKSIDLLQKSITNNPNHPGSHYLLGLIALEDGRVTEGTMALLGYLLLAPNGSATENAILKLNEKFSDNYLNKGSLIFSRTGGDNFEEIDVILRNGLPLKKAYKIKSEFDDVIIRQVQAIAEYAAEHKSENGFFETTYVPWLADIVKKNQFEGFSYYILLGLEEKLGKKLTSQKKKILAFSDTYMGNGFWEVYAKRKMNHFGKQEEVTIYLQDGRPYLVGKVVNGKREGRFRLLRDNGNELGELNFVNDELDGLQKYFNEKGKVSEEKSFKNGNLDGKRTTYYENGNISLIETYKDGKLDGLSSSFYINGGKNCEGSFVNGEYAGKVTCYYENGSKKNELVYENGKLAGKVLSYDEAGNLSSEITYSLGERNGKTIEYYNGKVIKSEIEYKDGKASSTYKEYYPNGTLKEEIIYADNNPKSSIVYFSNGKKSHEATYDKDGNLASYTYYNNNGDKFFEETYKQGILKSGLQYEAGKQKPTEVAPKSYVIKNYNGIVLTSGKYDKNKKTGEWTYHYTNGVLSAKDKFENGLQSGISYRYNRDNRLERVSHYVQDSLNGVYEEYDSGVLEERYHYNKGKLNGPGKTYYADGKISSESFYADGDLTSKRYTYWQSGNLRLINTFVDGVSVRLETFGPDGKKENDIDYTNKNGKVVTVFNNGAEIHEYYMANGDLNGKYIIKDKAGKLITDCEYINGYRHGKYVNYGPAGVPLTEITYYAGKNDGVSKYFDLAGNLRMTDSYVIGDNTGMVTRYFHNKGKFTEHMEFDGSTDGEVKYYNLKGEPILITGYQNDELVYFIKMGKDGKLTEKVPVTQQTAKIVSVYPNGKNAVEINYVKGNLDGKYIITNTEGKPEYEAQYDMGLLDGQRVEYYSNGKIYKKEFFKDGDFEGLQEFFKEDGKPIISAEYKNDELHGICKIYTNGTLTQTKRYDSDKLVEIK